MTWVYVVAVLLLVVAVASAIFRSHYGIGDARVTFSRENSGTTVRVGRGNSLGSAIADGFGKLYADLSPCSRLETIRTRYRAMTDTLAQNRARMFAGDIALCESYLRKTKALLDARQAEEDRRELERRRKEQEAAARRLQREREREDRERRRQQEQAEQECRQQQREQQHPRPPCQSKARSSSVPSAEAAGMPAPLTQKTCGCFTHATLLELFRDRGLEYVDMSPKGGGFYFFDKAMAEELKIQKCQVSYAANGTKGTGGRPAWFIKFK